MEEIRALKADEIQCRVQIIKETGFSLLLYKDSRVDMSILDETFGPMNWKRRHTNKNHNCIISVWDADKEQWIEKEDTGSESRTEAEKGLASDSFKRAGFNWGIGRELYSAPFIWIKAKKKEVIKKNGKLRLNPRQEFSVQEIETDDGVIQKLRIIDKKMNIRFKMG